MPSRHSSRSSSRVCIETVPLRFGELIVLCAGNSIVVARNKLQSLGNYKNLQTLLTDINAAGVAEYAFPDLKLKEYRQSSRRKRARHEAGSARIFDEVSCYAESENTHDTAADSTIASEGKFAGCNLDLYKQQRSIVVKVRKWRLEDVKDFVLQQLFAGDQAGCTAVVDDAIKNLRTLQSYCNFLFETGGCRLELIVIQPIFILFMNWLIAQLPTTTTTMEVSAAQSQPGLKAKLRNFKGKYDEFVGQTDVVVTLGRANFAKSVANVNSIFELKSPFGTLYHKMSQPERTRSSWRKEVSGTNRIRKTKFLSRGA
jgi:hypothetical protein